ncbi:hypothetical protein [Sphingopyxis sp.]|jgi:hypothetical protein|uniref:hypothetical protein n=1 Tax=Sphingopyxis sp. TaxID=1908224 RepID=UPI0025EBA23D|nr:hypothetical protein [Sphingopyxis sp.]
MIDDFAADPHELRRQSLALGHETGDENANYPGIVSARALPVKGLDDDVPRVVGTPVIGAAGTRHGHCRLTLKGDRGRSGVHIDPANTRASSTSDCPNIAGAAPISIVTAATDSTTSRPRAAASPPRDITTSTRWSTRWSRVTVPARRAGKKASPPMRCNRPNLFSPWMFHNSAAGFGTTLADGRLVYLMFFAAA